MPRRLALALLLAATLAGCGTMPAAEDFARWLSEPPPPAGPLPVCYRSLAAVTCHPAADPLMPPGRWLPAPGQVP
jgi:hypothetical protein